MSGFVLDPHEGPAYQFHGATVVIKASGEHTFGQLGVMESAYPPGLVVPGHVHSGEDEMFYLLSGELAGFCEDDSWTGHARQLCLRAPRPAARLHGQQRWAGYRAGDHWPIAARPAASGSGRTSPPAVDR